MLGGSSQGQTLQECQTSQDGVSSHDTSASASRIMAFPFSYPIPEPRHALQGIAFCLLEKAGVGVAYGRGHGFVLAKRKQEETQVGGNAAVPVACDEAEHRGQSSALRVGDGGLEMGSGTSKPRSSGGFLY